MYFWSKTNTFNMIGKDKIYIYIYIYDWKGDTRREFY